MPAGTSCFCLGAALGSLPGLVNQSGPGQGGPAGRFISGDTAALIEDQRDHCSVRLEMAGGRQEMHFCLSSSHPSQNDAGCIRKNTGAETVMTS